MQVNTKELIKALDKVEPLDSATPHEIHQYLVSASLSGIMERLDQLYQVMLPRDTFSMRSTRSRYG